MNDKIFSGGIGILCSVCYSFYFLATSDIVVSLAMDSITVFVLAFVGGIAGVLGRNLVKKKRKKKDHEEK